MPAMRVAIFTATALLAGCPSGKPDGPHGADDTALRVRIAQAEARRSVKELVTLAHGGTRELALRGLGRSGAIEELEQLGGSAGIGIAAALDDLTRPARVIDPDGAGLPAPSAQLDMEALGRAGDAASQVLLARCVATNPACGIAL